MLNKNEINKLLENCLTTGADYSEIYFEECTSNKLTYENAEVTASTSEFTYGAGVRIALNSNSVYGYTNDVTIEGLERLSNELKLAFDEENKEITVNVVEELSGNINKVINHPKDITIDTKVEYLEKAYNVAKNESELISKVVVNILDKVQNVVIATSENKLVKDERVHVRLVTNIIATDGVSTQTATSRPGSHSGYEYFEEFDYIQDIKDAATIALTMLKADECPSGEFTVVIDNKFGGVIFHEACGHGLEATSVSKNTSVFSNKIGTKIASELVTAIDDGTIPNGWGSNNFDDEGNKTSKNVLIENGVLKNYLVDKINGRSMKMTPNGCTRRESYRYAPTSRMSNTYIDNGESTFEEIIANTEHGIYAKSLGGGSVNTTTGDFNFAVLESYMIENGKITKPVRGATLIGNGADILHKIDMVGNNLDCDRGMCGSISGSIPADVGQPTIRVNNLTVGGRGESK